MGEENDELKLKRCPFCGEEAAVYHAFIPWNQNYAWIAGCEGSWGSMCPGYAWKLSPLFLTAEQAIRTWNRRAEDG